MTRLNRRTALAALGASLLSACAGPERIGEGGKKPPKGGIGGTGIVGTLTDFGSVIVNGLRIRTDAETLITSALSTISKDGLGLGQSLTVEAATDADGLIARRIHVTHPLIGRIDAVAADDQSFMIAGIKVALAPGASGRPRRNAIVAVSGLWRGDAIVATRLDPSSKTTATVIAGAVAEDATGLLTLGGRRLVLNGAEAPPVGSFVTAMGMPTAEGFGISALTAGRFTGAAGPLSELSIEGYLAPVAAAPFYTVSGLGHSFDEDARLAPFRDGRTLFSGRYVGTFAVETGIPLPEDVSARRALMRQILDGRTEGALPAR